MFNFLKKLFGVGTNAEPTKAQYKIEAPATVETAPHKVPEPAATTPIPLVVEPVVNDKPVKAKPAKAQAPAKPKKPRTPKKPKMVVAK